LTDKERLASLHDISGGGAVHLVDVYAHNAVREIIQNARIIISSERGRFTLPSGFMDRLVMDCGKWVLDNGATEAERAVRDRINGFLDERAKFKDQDNERKVNQSLKGTGYRGPGTG
jgi:hypothetical protein